MIKIRCLCILTRKIRREFISTKANYSKYSVNINLLYMYLYNIYYSKLYCTLYDYNCFTLFKFSKLIKKINKRNILYKCILSFSLKSVLDSFCKFTMINFKCVLLLTQLFFIFHVLHWIFVKNVII